MKTKLALTLLTIMVPASAQAPDLSHYYVAVPYAVAVTQRDAAQMYADTFNSPDTQYMSGYFAGRASVYREMTDQIEQMAPK